MFVVLIVLTLIAAVLLIGVVLIQKSKGGGLSSSFAGSNQIMGVRRTNSFIEKMTWTLVGCYCRSGRAFGFLHAHGSAALRFACQSHRSGRTDRSGRL